MIVTRFAPSPTGEPHIGNIRTALFAWIFARATGGVFFVRIEDTDRSREVPGAVPAIVEAMEWLGLTYDKNFIFQSQRLDIYKKYAEALVQKGHAYICTCSQERLKKLREKQAARKEPPMYDGRCRELKTRASKLTSCVIRLKVPQDGVTEFVDLIRDTVRFKYKLIDDQVLLKSDGYPTYHLANVVDDHDMAITHVIRGEDWLSSTPKHLLLYGYLGWTPPLFAHLPMILGTDKAKLSKRHGAMSVLEYKRAGFLPDALFNYLALLGWHPSDDREVLSREEIVAQFSLERVQKSAAVFDPEKLAWMNGRYLRALTPEKLGELLLAFGARYDAETKFVLEHLPERARMGTAALVAERMRTLADFAPLARFLVQQPEYDEDLLIFKSESRASAKRVLTMIKDALDTVPESEFTHDRLLHHVSGIIAQEGVSAGAVFHPLRVALTGLKDSPGPLETAEVLGKTETLCRIQRVLQKIS